jgi:hypothetical protein
MQVFLQLIIALAVIPFIGLVLYSVIGTYYLIEGGSDGTPVNRREWFGRIPKPVRRIGFISTIGFVGLFAFGVIVSLIARLLK